MQNYNSGEDETIYEVVIKLSSKGLCNELNLSVEILPEWAEKHFREIESIPGKVPSVLMAADAILKFIEAGMAEPGEEGIAAVTQNIVN